MAAGQERGWGCGFNVLLRVLVRNKVFNFLKTLIFCFFALSSQESENVLTLIPLLNFNSISGFHLVICFFVGVVKTARGYSFGK